MENGKLKTGFRQSRCKSARWGLSRSGAKIYSKRLRWSRNLVGSARDDVSVEPNARERTGLILGVAKNPIVKASILARFRASSASISAWP